MNTRILAAAMAAVPLAYTAQGAAIPVDPRTTVTATMDGGTAKTGNTWYERGVNTAAPTTGLRSGLIAGQSDALSTYLFRPADALNTLLLDPTATGGTLTFANPLAVGALSFAASTGSGTGTIVPTLRYADNSSFTAPALTVGDWFNLNPRVQTAGGRIHAVNNAFANVNANLDANDANPRVLAINYTLPPGEAFKAIKSIDLSWTGSDSTTYTAIFGVSGDVTGIGHFTAIPLTADSFTQDVIVGVTEAIPEPGMMPLILLGAGLLWVGRRGERR